VLSWAKSSAATRNLQHQENNRTTAITTAPDKTLHLNLCFSKEFRFVYTTEHQTSLPLDSYQI
jgi:hypothetical protein